MIDMVYGFTEEELMILRTYLYDNSCTLEHLISSHRLLIELDDKLLTAMATIEDVLAMSHSIRP